MSEPAQSSTDVAVKLMGDWSWRLPRTGQTDAGHVWTAEQVAALNNIRAVPGIELVHTQSVPKAKALPVRVQVLPMRPWSFPAYKATSVMPPRIGPVMG